MNLSDGSEKRVTEKPPKPRRSQPNLELSDENRFFFDSGGRSEAAMMMLMMGSRGAGGGAASTSDTDENDITAMSLGLNEEDMKELQADITLGHTKDEDTSSSIDGDGDGDYDDGDESRVSGEKENRPSRDSAGMVCFKATASKANLPLDSSRTNRYNKQQNSFFTTSIANSSHFNDLTNVSEATFFDVDSKLPSNEVSVSNLVNFFTRWRFDLGINN